MEYKVNNPPLHNVYEVQSRRLALEGRLHGHATENAWSFILLASKKTGKEHKVIFDFYDIILSLLKRLCCISAGKYSHIFRFVKM